MIGATTKTRVVFVSYCQRGEWIRTISARLATRSERKQYEEGTDSQEQLLDPDLAALFPDSAAVNRALRVFVEAALAATPSKRRGARCYQLSCLDQLIP
jgi:hypothetical protein